MTSMEFYYLARSGHSSSSDEVYEDEEQVALEHQAHRNRVAKLTSQVPVPCLTKECWQTSTETFNVRSSSYLKDKKKYPCKMPMFDLHGMDMLETGERSINNIVKTLPNGLAARYLETPTEDGSERPLMFIVHFQLPSIDSKKYSMVAYFVAKPGVCTSTKDSVSMPCTSLLQRFMDESDDFRKARFKLIPSVANAPYLVRGMLGNTPVILGNKLTQTYHRGEGYMEVCVDVNSSTIGVSTFKMLKSYIKALTIDLAFVLEGKNEAELPEVLLGDLKISNIDIPKHAKSVVGEMV